MYRTAFDSVTTSSIMSENGDNNLGADNNVNGAGDNNENAAGGDNIENRVQNILADIPVSPIPFLYLKP